MSTVDCGCPKRLYHTEGEAIANALAASRRTGVGLRVYPCPAGRGWHLTKRPKRDGVA